MTQYLLLIYSEPSMGASTEAEAAAVMGEYRTYTQWLIDQGWMRGGDALHEASQATTVRVREGDRLVVDGPFAETKEQLGGYYLIDVEHLDDAIEAAARCPGARHGSMEIRPIMPTDMPT
jgi:hypothetical protein